MNPSFDSQQLRELLATLRTWQTDLARLILYRHLLQTEVGRSWQVLLQELLNPHPQVDRCLRAYGDWFIALANQGQRWADQIQGAIVADDNPFSQEVQHYPLEDVALGLQVAASQDLDVLQGLAKIDLSVATRTLEQVAYPLSILPVENLFPVDLSPRHPGKTFAQVRGQAIAALFTSPHPWSDRLPQLAEFYRQWGVGVWNESACFQWRGQVVRLTHPDPIKLDHLVGYPEPKRQLLQNTEFLLQGYRAQNVLLYGSRGSGKSSLVKALIHTYGVQGLRLIEVPKAALQSLPEILDRLRASALKFIIFVDDLSFEEDDDSFKALKVLLEGSLVPRPVNVVVYATSNRRNLIRENFDDRPRPQAAQDIHAWDTVQEKLSFRDRFGLTLTFEPADQETYLAMVHHLAQLQGLSLDPATLEAQAKQWATRHNGQSGRSAQQFIDWCLALQQSV